MLDPAVKPRDDNIVLWDDSIVLRDDNICLRDDSIDFMTESVVSNLFRSNLDLRTGK